MTYYETPGGAQGVRGRRLHAGGIGPPASASGDCWTTCGRGSRVPRLPRTSRDAAFRGDGSCSWPPKRRTSLSGLRDDRRDLLRRSRRQGCAGALGRRPPPSNPLEFAALAAATFKVVADAVQRTRSAASCASPSSRATRIPARAGSPPARAGCSARSASSSRARGASAPGAQPALVSTEMLSPRFGRTAHLVARRLRGQRLSAGRLCSSLCEGERVGRRDLGGRAADTNVAAHCGSADLDERALTGRGRTRRPRAPNWSRRSSSARRSTAWSRA